MVALIRWTGKWCLRLAVLGCVLLAVASIAIRLLLSNAQVLQQWVEDTVNEQWGQTLQIQGMQLQWRGLHAYIAIERAQLGEPLQLERLRAYLDLPETLLLGSAQFTRIDVGNLQLSLQQRADGRYLWPWGARQSSGTLDWQGALDWLESQPAVALEQVQLQVQPAQGDAWRIQGEGRCWSRRELACQFSAQHDNGEQLSLQLERTTAWRRLAAEQVTLHLQTPGLSSDAWLGLQDFPLGVSGQLWLQHNRDQGWRLQSQLQVANQQSPLEASAWRYLDLDLGASLQQDQWQFSSQELQIDTLDGRLSFPIRAQGSWPLQQIQVDIPRLNIARLQALAGQLPPQLTELLSAGQWQGTLQQVQLQLQRQAASWQLLSAAGEGANVGLQQHPQLPNWQPGQFSWHWQQDWLWLNAKLRQSAFDWPQMFRQPWQLQQAQAEILLDLSADTTQVYVLDAELQTPELQFAGALHLALRPQQRPQLHSRWQWRGRLNSRESIRPYLPLRGLKPKPRAWLDNAFSNTLASAGYILLHADLDDFPFNHPRATFDIGFELQSGTLNYRKDWPQISDIQGWMRFYDDGLTGEVSQAQMSGVPLRQVSVEINSFFRRFLPTLVVRGQAPAFDFQQGVAFVADSPLQGKIGRWLTPLAVDAPLALNLDLQLPLVKQAGKLQLDGRIELQDNQLSLLGSPLQFTQVQGALAFDLSGIWADELQAQLWGQPVQARIASANPPTRRTMIQLETQVTMADLAQQFQLPWLQLLQGELPLNAEVQVAGPSVQINVAADATQLQGDLPAALHPRHLSEPLSMTYALGTEPRQLTLEAPGQWRAGLSLAEQGITAGSLQFGSAARQPQPTQGFAVTGRIPQLHSEPLWALAEQLQPYLPKDQAQSSLPQVTLDLEVDEFILPQQRLDTLRLSGQSLETGWQLALSSQPIMAQLTREGEAYRLAAQRLHWPISVEKVSEAKAQGQGLDPLSIPALTIQARDIKLGDFQLQQADLVATPLPDGVQITGRQVSADWGEITPFNLLWQRQQGQDITQANLTVSSPDMGKMAQAFGFSSNLRDSVGEAELDLIWAGSPLDFQLEQLQGDVRLQLGAGRLVDIEPGAGRAIGLLSLDAVRRRLLLDFRDLYKKGFVFDELSGNFVFEQGVVKTCDTLLTSPAAEVSFCGKADLLAKNYDQEVIVVPAFSASLPIAATLAGGPAVGAAAWVAKRWLQSTLNQITSFKYHVTGPWQSPKVESLGKFVFKKPTPASVRE